MKLSPYIIQELAPIVIGDSYTPYRKGPQLVRLFNKYGAKDVYDDLGLPDVKKQMAIDLQERSILKLDYKNSMGRLK